MTDREHSVLVACPLFSGMDSGSIFQILKKASAYTEDFAVKESIPLRKNGNNRIGILLSGGADVFSSGEGKVLLNRLGESSVFGVSYLFGKEGADTEICTGKKSRILFLEEPQSEVLWEHPILRKNLILFLTDRILFLNRKIAFLSEGGAKGKLYRFLLDRADESGRVSLPCSFSELAKILNIGRASLYRALEKMETEGILQKEKKSLRLLLPDESKLF
jgi:CRP-like cAMP-binding protein